MIDLAVYRQSSDPRVGSLQLPAAQCVRVCADMAHLGLAQHLEAVTEELRLLDDELRKAKRERQQLQVRDVRASKYLVSKPVLLYWWRTQRPPPPPAPVHAAAARSRP